MQNWVEADFVAYTTGSVSGKLVSNDAPTGCVYIIKTVKAGQVTVGVQLSPNKGFHILDKDFAEVTGYTYNLPRFCRSNRITGYDYKCEGRGNHS